VFILLTTAALCACTSVTGDEARVSVLFTEEELRAVIIATEYGPYSSEFSDNAALRHALETARQKMVGVAAATR
jgi:hypothetical protein